MGSQKTSDIEIYFVSNKRTVMLIGGMEGNVFTRNILTDAFGPICGDTWNNISVIDLLNIILNDCYKCNVVCKA